jgi:hypothetical protein
LRNNPDHANFAGNLPQVTNLREVVRLNRVESALNPTCYENYSAEGFAYIIRQDKLLVFDP